MWVSVVVVTSTASGLAGAAVPVQLSDALKDPLDVTHLCHAEVLNEQ